MRVYELTLRELQLHSLVKSACVVEEIPHECQVRITPPRLDVMELVRLKIAVEEEISKRV